MLDRLKVDVLSINI